MLRLHFDIDPSTPSPYSYPPSNVFCDSPNPASPSDLTNIDGSSGFYGSLNPSAANSNSITGLPQQPRQKGRPRKRKPKDIEAMTANLGELLQILINYLSILFKLFAIFLL
jgi:LIM homeobox protein 2/9